MIRERRPISEMGEQASAIAVHLATQLRGRLRKIRVVVEPEGVVVCGVANSYRAKQLAQHAIMRVFALPIVANEITVPAAGLRDHDWISTKVQRTQT